MVQRKWYKIWYTPQTMAKKNPLLKGVYKHGSLYWFRTQVDGKRQAFSLGTDDLSKAIREAAKIRSGESAVKIEGEVHKDALYTLDALPATLTVRLGKKAKRARIT